MLIFENQFTCAVILSDLTYLQIDCVMSVDWEVPFSGGPIVFFDQIL